MRDNPLLFFPKNLLRCYSKCIFGLTRTKQSVFFSDTILGRRKEGFNTAEADEEYWKETRRFLVQYSRICPSIARKDVSVGNTQA